MDAGNPGSGLVSDGFAGVLRAALWRRLEHLLATFQPDLGRLAAKSFLATIRASRSAADRGCRGDVLSERTARVGSRRACDDGLVRISNTTRG